MLIEKQDEQLVEDLFQFWKRYKVIAIGSFLTIVTAIVIYSYSTAQFQKRLLVAAEHYQNAIEAIDRQDEHSLQRSLDILQQEYASSPYASMATMTRTGELMRTHQLDEAEKHTDWLMKKSTLPLVKSLATYKKAELCYLKKNFDESLAYLATLKDESLILMTDHLRAKNYAHLNKIDESLALYKSILEKNELDDAHKALLVAEYNYLYLTNYS
jgi:predicted negative regulator of RcsB-dependent stress response